MLAWALEKEEDHSTKMANTFNICVGKERNWLFYISREGQNLLRHEVRSYIQQFLRKKGIKRNEHLHGKWLFVFINLGI
jgi:hypothetical protein